MLPGRGKGRRKGKWRKAAMPPFCIWWVGRDLVDLKVHPAWKNLRRLVDVGRVFRPAAFSCSFEPPPSLRDTSAGGGQKECPFLNAFGAEGRKPNDIGLLTAVHIFSLQRRKKFVGYQTLLNERNGTMAHEYKYCNACRLYPAVCDIPDLFSGGVRLFPGRTGSASFRRCPGRFRHGNEADPLRC